LVPGTAVLGRVRKRSSVFAFHTSPDAAIAC
jgi:hypothetical protein